MRFSLNHAICPLMPIPHFLELAGMVGVDTVELRDGMPPGWQLPPAANVMTYSPEAIAGLSNDSGIGVVSINALQRFDLWDRERAEQARTLVGFAEAAGIPNLVLCPSVAEPGLPAAQSQLEQGARRAAAHAGVVGSTRTRRAAGFHPLVPALQGGS